MEEPKEAVAAAIIRARAELEQALSDLEKLPPFDASSVAFVAHALSNFLTVTGFTVEFLMLSLADHADPQIRIWLENLQNATTLMTRAVNQLMNNAPIPETQLRFEKVNIPLGLHRVCAYYLAKADQKQIRLTCGPFEKLPPVWTDRVTAGAVLDNLMSNALKFSPPGKNVYLGAVREQDSVVVSVCDEGPGLSKEEQVQLFQRGVRLSPQPTAGEPSTGYGLAVAKELVEQLGGRNLVCERTGTGIVFFGSPAYLPRTDSWSGTEPDQFSQHNRNPRLTEFSGSILLTPKTCQNFFGMNHGSIERQVLGKCTPNSS